MRWALLVLSVGWSLTCLPASGLQEPHSATDGQSLSVNVELVNVIFSVLDPRGRFVSNLSQNDFRVYENGQPQIVTHFSADPNLPLTVALLIDTSGSVRDRLRFEKEAAIEFFESTLTRNTDRGLTLSFDSGVDLIQDFTADTDSLAQSIRGLRAGGGTALYEAIDFAANRKLAGQAGRRVIVIISDGEDNLSHISMDDALESAQRNEVVIYAISTSAVQGARKDRGGDEILRMVADETGGKFFCPTKLQSLASSFRDITNELRLQYSLTYQSTNPMRDGKFRQIRIEPTNKRYIARARNGYYAGG